MRARFVFDGNNTCDEYIPVDGNVFEVVDVLFNYLDGDRMMACKHATLRNEERDDGMFCFWESTLEYLTED